MAHLITVLAAPLYLVLIALELWIDRKRGTHYYRLNDAIASMSLGVISRTHRLIIFAVGAYVVSHWLPKMTLVNWEQHQILAWVIAFIGYDLTYYWNHRINHEINCLWAGHVVHHQSEDYNLSTALRQTSGGFFDWIFAIPLYMTGIPIDIIVACAGFNLLYQFWVHTQHIDKCGWMEKWFVTPSHHRVHHAQNPLYWDRNYGGVFIIWDKIFNSFQEERKDTPIIYGVSRALHTMNPLKANLQVWWHLLRDAIHCNSIWDKFRIWFMPTGWRPAGMEDKFPFVKPNLDSFEKYNPPIDKSMQAYALFQFSAGLITGFYFIFHFANLDIELKLLGWLFVTLPLISTGYLLDRGSLRWEILRYAVSVVGFALCWRLLSMSSALIFGIYLALNLPLLTLLLKKQQSESAH